MRYYKKGQVSKVQFFFQNLLQKKLILLGILLLILILGFFAIKFGLEQIGTEQVERSFIPVFDDALIDDFSRLPSRLDFIYPHLVDGFIPDYPLSFVPGRTWEKKEVERYWQESPETADILREENDNKLKSIFSTVP